MVACYLHPELGSDGLLPFAPVDTNNTVGVDGISFHRRVKMEKEINSPVKLIGGGIYSSVGQDGSYIEGTCISVKEANGVRKGEIKFLGYKPELYVEGTDQTNALKLVGRPASPKIGRPRKSGK